MNNDHLEPLANSMLVLFECCSACMSLSGDKLYDPFWEAMSYLELCEFKVMGLTCDGLSANCLLFSLHDPSAELLHKVPNPPNPYAEDDRTCFFVDWVKTHRITSVCIHVGRAIGRSKIFRILESVPNSTHNTANQLFFVCALLTNFQPALVE